jgi:hypothetical protein
MEGYSPYADAFTAEAKAFCKGGPKGARWNEKLLFLSVETHGEIF